MPQEEKLERNHDIRLIQREVFIANGVLYVESFDDTSLSLSTGMGDLMIEGFSKEEGTVRIIGKVQALYYSDVPKVKKKFFGKLFQ